MKRVVSTCMVVLLALVFHGSATAQTQQVMYTCNFDCPSCEDKVMKNLPYEKGVKNVNVDVENKLVVVDFKTSKNSAVGIQKALVELGYETQNLGTPLSFGVKGNCDMCKDKIETAAKSVDGVELAMWDADKQELKLGLSTSAPDEIKIHEAIAAIGYDTDKVTAKDEVYENLHHCCKYER